MDAVTLKLETLHSPHRSARLTPTRFPTTVGAVLISTLLWVFFSAIGFAGESSVTIDGRQIDGITKVVRITDSRIGIRYSDGLIQAEVSQVSDSFLQSWNLSRVRSKTTASNAHAAGDDSDSHPGNGATGLDGPQWDEPTSAELARFLERFELVIIPSPDQPGIYFRKVWIPLNEPIATIRSKIPAFSIHYQSSNPHDIRIENMSMYLVFTGGSKFRKLFVEGGMTGLATPPSAIILDGLKFGADPTEVREVMGKPDQTTITGELIYYRGKCTLRLGFYKGRFFFINFGSRGFESVQ